MCRYDFTVNDVVECFMLTLYDNITSHPLHWYIYDDEAVAQPSRDALINLLRHFGQSIACINAQTIAEGFWQEDAHALILPGGQSRFFARSLQGNGNAMIQSFIENGGNVLGVCGGAYYLSHFSYFNFSSPYALSDEDCQRKDVIETTKTEREMYVFEGMCKGPFTSDQKVMLSVEPDTNMPFDHFECVIRGGGAFQEHESVAPPYMRASTLARYPSGEAAIIKGDFGKGKYILSGPHIEMLGDVETIARSIVEGISEEDLLATDEGRQYLFFVSVVLMNFLSE